MFFWWFLSDSSNLSLPPSYIFNPHLSCENADDEDEAVVGDDDDDGALEGEP